MPKTDLSLVSIDDLILEIDRRYDFWVFSGLQIRSQQGSQILTTRKWKGNSATCAGLCSQLQVVIFDHHLDHDDSDDQLFEV